MSRKRGRRLGRIGLSVVAAECAACAAQACGATTATTPPEALVERAIERAGGRAALERARALVWEGDGAPYFELEIRMLRVLPRLEEPVLPGPR